MTLVSPTPLPRPYLARLQGSSAWPKGAESFLLLAQDPEGNPFHIRNRCHGRHPIDVFGQLAAEPLKFQGKEWDFLQIDFWETVKWDFMAASASGGQPPTRPSKTWSDELRIPTGAVRTITT